MVTWIAFSNVQLKSHKHIFYSCWKKMSADWFHSSQRFWSDRRSFLICKQQTGIGHSCSSRSSSRGSGWQAWLKENVFLAVWPQWQYWSCEWEPVLPNIRHKTTMVKDNGEKITWKVWILRCSQVRKMHMRCQLCSARRYFTELWISTLEDLLLVIRAAQRANVLQSQGKLFKRFKTGMVK